MAKMKYDQLKKRLGKRKTDKLMHDQRRERRQTRDSAIRALKQRNPHLELPSSSSSSPSGNASVSREEGSIPDDVFLRDMQRFEEASAGTDATTPEMTMSATVFGDDGRAWKRVDLQQGFQDLGGLMSVDVLEGDEAEALQREWESKRGVADAHREGPHEEKEGEEDAAQGQGKKGKQKKKKKKKKSKSSGKKEEEGEGEAAVQEQGGEEEQAVPKKDQTNKSKKSKKRRRDDAEDDSNRHGETREPEGADEKPFEFDEALMEAWRPYADVVHEDVLENLQKMGFVKPTSVQEKALELIVEDPQRNVIAAAETGSGKTLAFGIPLVSAILDNKDAERQIAEAQLEKTLSATQQNNGKRVKLSHASDGSGNAKKNTAATRKNQKMKALVLTPTRELAIQVSNHIKAITKDTSVFCAAIVGGMSVEKQERILSYGPEIVVATPGRFWELANSGVSHLSDIDELRCICIDEADRMLAEGHFDEVYSILNMINRVRLRQEEPCLLQKFVLSATLTLDSKWRGRSAQDDNSMVDKLLRVLDMEDHSIIDLTPKGQLARTLQETHLLCLENEKDTYLYYLVFLHPGRTIVFCNSITAVRHLQTLLTILKLPVHAIHGEMQQRQRLKNLDRFRTEETSILVATDVAARGLDIPNVDSVIHFQMPRDVETYVHRCGRTGRANKSGISVALVAPEDRKNYIKFCAATEKSGGMDEFPVNVSTIKQLSHRIKLAQEIERYDVEHKKQKSDEDWFQKNAEAADIDLDETFFPEFAGDADEEMEVWRKRISHRMEKLKERLKKSLSSPLVDEGISVKFVAADPSNLASAQKITHRDKTIQQAFTDIKQSSNGKKLKKRQKSNFRRLK